MATQPLAVVWGNCQAVPLADILTGPLAAQGFRVVPVPPVYLITASELQAARRVISECALLITQPVRAQYRMPGTGWEELAGIAPSDVRVVTYPVSYDSTEFPFQIVGHETTGLGGFAPLTGYHDIRLMVAAERGWDVGKVLEWLPQAAAAAALQAVSAHSLAELRRRESTLDVSVSGALGRLGSSFTVNHPADSVLTHVAAGILAALDSDALQRPDALPPLAVPVREALGHTVTALEPMVLAAHGWPADRACGWRVGDHAIDLTEIVTRHLELLRSQPELTADARRRYAWQFDLLGF